MEGVRSLAVQAAAGGYLAFTFFSSVDEIVKALVGLAMLVLVIYQIRSVRTKLRRLQTLEQLVAQASTECSKASAGNCPLKLKLSNPEYEP